MRAALLVVAFVTSSLTCALTPNLPRGEVEPHLVVNTRVGPFYHAVRYAAPIIVPAEAVPQRLSGHGVYVVEVGIVTGYPLDVRVLESSGHRILDDAAVAALRQWRFRPRSVYKATIPIDFGFVGSRVRVR
jgi:TonB family protein